MTYEIQDAVYWAQAQFYQQNLTELKASITLFDTLLYKIILMGQCNKHITLLH